MKHSHSRHSRRTEAANLLQRLEPRTLFTAAPTPFTPVSLGPTNVAGTSSYSGGALTITAANQDAFTPDHAIDSIYYVYAKLIGNGSIRTRVTENLPDPANTDPLAGLDIRTSLDPGAQNVFIANRSGTDVIVNHRDSSGHDAVNQSITPANQPVYLELQRTGDVITELYSTNGVSYKTLGTATLPGLPTDVLIGFAQGSQNESVVSTAVYDDIATTGEVVSAVPGAGPTATATLTNITAGSAQTYTFPVTYAAANDVSAASVGNGNIVVTGPNGYSQAATVVTEPTADATSLTVNYQLNPAPSSAGTYTVNLESHQISDAAGNLTAGQVLGTFTATIPSVTSSGPTGTGTGSTGSGTGSTGTGTGSTGTGSGSTAAGPGPTAALWAPDITAGSGPIYNFGVTYASANDVSAASIGDGNIIVTGPNGYDEPATAVNPPAADAANIQAHYQMNPAPSYPGTYTITLVPNQIADASGNRTTGQVLGTFTVPFIPSVTGTITNAATGAPLAGVRVFFDIGKTGVETSTDPWAITDSTGFYEFGPAGNHTFRVAINSTVGDSVATPTTGYLTENTVLDATQTGVNFTLNAPTPAVGAAPSLPVLTGTFASLPTAIQRGKHSSLTLELTNTGAVTATGTIKFQLASNTAATSTGDVVLKTFKKKIKLAAGASVSLREHFTAPVKSTPAGNRYVVALIDTTNVIDSVTDVVASPTTIPFS